MYKTSTYFIKAQIPDICIERLLALYKRELKDQGVSNSAIDNNTIHFSNNTFGFNLNRQATKFSSFKSGSIIIEDVGNEYQVTLEADNSRSFTFPIIISSVIVVIPLLTNHFELSLFFVAAIVFLLISGGDYGMTRIFFPVYFTSLRNKFERELQEAR